VLWNAWRVGQVNPDWNQLLEIRGLFQFFFLSEINEWFITPPVIPKMRSKSGGASTSYPKMLCSNPGAYSSICWNTYKPAPTNSFDSFAIHLGVVIHLLGVDLLPVVVPHGAVLELERLFQSNLNFKLGNFM